MRKSFISALRTMVVMLALSLCVSNSYAFVVVIDAGHGGTDPGAIGKISKEKNLNLAVSQRLGKLISDNCDDVKVYLTRNTDVFLTLQERADFVNKHNADLFICIHANSADNKSVRGAETFTLGVDKMASNLNVAMRENSVILLEDDYQTKYQGFNPQSVESYIMFEFMQDRYIDKSLQYATLVQEQFSDKLHRADRGVRQAGFWVLHKSACPSVLVEMGFISNVEEEKYLASDKGKNEIANAIYQAFVQYKSQLDKKARNVQEAQTSTQTAPKEKETKPQTSPQPSPKEKEAQLQPSAEVAEAKLEETKPAETQPAETKPFETKPAETQPAETKPQDTKPAEVKPTEQGSQQKKSRPVFCVQIFAVSAPLKAGDPTFKGLKGCKYVKDGNLYKYTYGETEDYDEILEMQKSVRQKFKDCFVVAFLDGKRIPVKQALEMK